MERLTKKLEHFGGYSARLSKTIWQCIDRLGQYEDTGLTPEQIREIDQLYSEKCREVAEYQKKLGEATGVKEAGHDKRRIDC